MRLSYSKFLLAFSCLVLTLSAPLPLLSMENEENEKDSAIGASLPALQKEKWRDSLYEFPEIEAGFKIKVFNTLFLNPDFKNGKNQKALFECLEKAAFERLNLQALEKVKLFSTQSVLHISQLDPKMEERVQKRLVLYSSYNKIAKLQKVPLGTYAFNVGNEALPINYGMAKKFLLHSLEWPSGPITKGNALLTLGLLHEEWRSSKATNLKLAQHFLEFCYSPQTYERAIKFFETGDLNDSEIQYRLGCCYRKLDKYNEAVMWFEKSLNQCRKRK